MSELDKYVVARKKRDKNFAQGYDEGYDQLKIGVMLRQAREEAGLTHDSGRQLVYCAIGASKRGARSSPWKRPAQQQVCSAAIHRRFALFKPGINSRLLKRQ